MANRNEIIEFCDELLDVGTFSDYGPNGLQVPGDDEVGKIVTGVSAHRELIASAVDAGAQMAITHHGLFWDFLPRALSEPMAERLRLALGAGLSVAAYHLPLDAHPEIGNNALIRDGLGFEPSPEPFGLARDQPIGVVGRSAEGIGADQLVERVRALTERDPLVFATGPDPVHSIGIASGAGASMVHEAVGLGPRRPAHRRARRACDGRRTRGWPSFHRRRALRDRDFRGPPARGARRRALRRGARVHHRAKPCLNPSKQPLTSGGKPAFATCVAHSMNTGFCADIY